MISQKYTVKKLTQSSPLNAMAMHRMDAKPYKVAAVCRSKSYLQMRLGRFARSQHLCFNAPVIAVQAKTIGICTRLLDHVLGIPGSMRLVAGMQQKQAAIGL
tara:strand:+ start:8288 stop:8593 length:306 start_codon:yes stop_codon:yes gene_type:complete